MLAIIESAVDWSHEDREIAWRIAVLVALVIIYSLPIAFAWRKKHRAGIVVLTVCLGWTLLGWVGAMVWAVSSPRRSATPV